LRVRGFAATEGYLRVDHQSVRPGQGYSLLTIQKVLNHASPVSTSVYERLDLIPVRAALEANAEAMFGGK